jgi:trafficking protein particle complex subunit 9
MSLAIQMYFKAPLADNSNDYPSVVLLYTSSILRYTHFLFSIWSSNGWGPMAFLTMLTPALPPSFVPEPPNNARRWRMTSMTTITRTHIANIAAQAHGAWIMHLQPHDRIRLLSALAGFYSCLGFGRKEVYVLRELVSVLMDLIVLAREEKLEQHAARLGVSDANLSELAASTPTHMSVREQQLTEGNQSILRILIHICGIYGVDLQAVGLKDGGGRGVKNEEWEREAESIDFARQATYGWSELQLGAVREALAFTEALPGELHSDYVVFD